MVVYKNAKFHTPSNATLAPMISDFFMKGLEVVGSEEEIALTFSGVEEWRDNDTHQVECVYWDEGEWSNYGCRWKDGTCYCNHTTAFTALLVCKRRD